MSSFHKHLHKLHGSNHHKKDKEEHNSHNHHHHHHNHHHNHKAPEINDYQNTPLDHEKITDTADFNSLRTYEAFKACICKDGVNIDLPQLIVAYRELIKFINMLGRIFGFVSWELNDKCGNVDKCIKKEPTKYRTVAEAIEHEKSTNIYKVHQNTSISLLRLLRGLDFIRRLVEKTYDQLESDKKLPELAYSAYEDTLAFRHRWAIRHLVRVGMYLLPTKEVMIDLILKTAPPCHHYKEHDTIIREFIAVLNEVYSLVHKTYQENEFLELVFV